MLDKLRQTGGKWLVKFILAPVLILSFAVWGIADVFTGYGQRAIATVGDVEITPDQFQRAYRNGLAQLSNQVRKQLTPEQARAFGLETQTLSRLMGSAAIDRHAGDLDLGLSDSAVAASIRSNPIFQSTDGSFSRTAFDDILRRIDMSEAGFIVDQRREKVRRHLTDALVADIVPPAPLVAAMHRFQNETRVIKFFTLDPKRAGKVAAPEEKRLKSHYEANKAQFMTPEYRALALLAISRRDAMSRVPITDDELKKTFQDTRQAYDVAEKRHVQQVSFKDQAAALKAYGRLSIAKDFEATAKALGFAKSDYDLGLLAKSDMLDEQIAAAAFKLRKNKVSEPVKGLFNVVLLHVSEIKPGKTAKFAEVKDKVRDKLASERASQELQSLHDLVDDERGAGKTLKEIAAKLKLKSLDIAAVDKFGKGRDGKAAIKHAEAPAILRAVFAGEIGIENDLIELSDGGYAWFDILGQTAATQKTFEQVKADVKAVVMDLDTRQAISNGARETVRRIVHGEDFGKVAKALGLTVTTSKAIKRSDSFEGLSRAAIARAFVLGKNAAATALSEDGKSRTILTVNQIKVPPAPSETEAKALSRTLGQQMTGDTMAEYVTALMKRYGQSVNNAAFRRATGQEPQ